MLWASLFDRFTDFPRRGKDKGCAIALHAGANDNRLARRRAELARVGLEAQVEFPDLLALAVRGVHRVGIAAMPDGGPLAFGWRLAKVELPASLGRRRLASRNRLQVGDEILARLAFLESGK